jgi:hypothetical protein
LKRRHPVDDHRRRLGENSARHDNPNKGEQGGAAGVAGTRKAGGRGGHRGISNHCLT